MIIARYKQWTNRIKGKGQDTKSQIMYSARNKDSNTAKGLTNDID